MIFFQKTSLLAASVIALSILGYPVSAVFAKVISVDNQIVAVGVRTVILMVAIILLLGRTRCHSKPVLILFTLFWFLYILRLAYTFGFSGEVVSVPASTFWLWGLGVCLIPSLAILVYGGPIDFSKTGVAISVLGLVAMAGILLIGGTAIETAQGTLADQNRWNLSTVNPITIGHLGSSLVLVGLAELLHGTPRIRRILFNGAIAGIGVIGIILANSRGPLVALIASLGVVGSAQIRRPQTWRYAILILLVGIGVAYHSASTLLDERGLIERFVSVMTGDDQSAQQRNQLFADGFAQFLASSMVGDGVEVRTQAYYPHNVTLEAFMTTGILGGFAFLVLEIASLRSSFRILKVDHQKAWLAMLAVQYIVAGQLSGSIYQSGAMWVLMAGVLAFDRSGKVRARAMSTGIRAFPGSVDSVMIADNRSRRRHG